MKKIQLSILVLIAICMGTSGVNAQCTPPVADVCSSVVSLSGVPASIPLCPGNVHSFTPIAAIPSPLTFDSYSWSVGPTSSSSVPGSASVSIPTTITGTAAATTYCLTVKALGPELVENGDFSLGNSCFTSGYGFDPGTAVTPGWGCHYLQEGDYSVRTDMTPYGAGVANFPDHTSGWGNMMIVNGSTAGTPVNVWTETLNVCPSSNYQFSLWYANWTPPTSPAQIEVLINGVSLTVDIATAAAGTWQQILVNWSSGSTTTGATIVIRDLCTSVSANDFVLDDISFRRVSTDTKCISVTLPIPTISGSPYVCDGSSVTLSGAPGGGTWTSSSPSIATIGLSSAIANGMSPGTTTIEYTGTNGCSNTFTLTVDPLPVAGPIIPAIPRLSGVACSGDVIGYMLAAGSMSGGTFSLGAGAPAGTSISSTTGVLTCGIVTIPTAVTVYYTVTTPHCGSATTSDVIFINPIPVFTVTGPLWACTGVPFMLMGSITSGCTSGCTYLWNFGSTTLIPTLSETIPGSYFYHLTVTNSFGCSATNTVSVDVDPIPVSGTIYLGGPISGIFCSGNVLGTSLSAGTTPGGVWSSSNTTVAPVSPSGGTFTLGTVTSPTFVTINYTVATHCGTAVSTVTILVNPLPVAVITGPTTICSGSTATLSLSSTSTPDGTWGSLTLPLATVTTSGIVTSLAVGTAIITYTATTACGTAIGTHTIDMVHPGITCSFTVYFDGTNTYFHILGTPNTWISYTIHCSGGDVSGRAFTGSSGIAAILYPVTGCTSFSGIDIDTAFIVPSPGDTCWDYPHCHIVARPGKDLDENTTEIVPYKNLSIVPNPNTGVFNLSGTLPDMAKATQVKVEIVDMLGKTIFTEMADIKNGVIDKKVVLDDNIASGIYIIKVKTDHESQVIRFNLQR